VADGTPIRSRVGYGLELTGAVGIGMARSLVGAAQRTTRGMRELTREAAAAQDAEDESPQEDSGDSGEGSA